MRGSEQMRTDSWINVPNTDGKYQANFNGQVRRVYKTKTKIISQYKKHNGSYVFKIVKDEVRASKVIWNAFKGEIPNGMYLVHKNGIKSDNCINNLELVTKKELGTRYGGNSRRKPVLKLNENGEIVECYKSVREAGKKNYMSYQTISDFCNYVTKKALADDGHAYCYDDEKCLAKTIRKIELAKGFMPKARDLIFEF